jgi:hypothetical protein
MATVANRGDMLRRVESRGMRAARSEAVRRAAVRESFYAHLRQRRRRGVLWGIVAALIILAAWDVAGRLDEVVYNAVFPSPVLEARHEAMR